MDPSLLRETKEFLEKLRDETKLEEADWWTVGLRLGHVREAISSNDPAGIREALANLAAVGSSPPPMPHEEPKDRSRVSDQIEIHTAATLLYMPVPHQVPESTRDEINVLVHEIDVTIQQRSGKSEG